MMERLAEAEHFFIVYQWLLVGFFLCIYGHSKHFKMMCMNDYPLKKLRMLDIKRERGHS